MTGLLTLRRGVNEDQDWLFDLFRSTMQNYIDIAWGWDELLQREGFRTSLPAKNFQILLCDGIRVGSYHLSEKPGYLLLDMILVDPANQRQGYGTQMMTRIKDRSRATRKPIHLSVLKTNPAVAFHKASGFQQIEEDRHSIRMTWIADAP
jgi:N-acetylglutamate synthase-like GNAT family acetyltransferase